MYQQEALVLQQAQFGVVFREALGYCFQFIALYLAKVLFERSGVDDFLELFGVVVYLLADIINPGRLWFVSAAC